MGGECLLRAASDDLCRQRGCKAPTSCSMCMPGARYMLYGRCVEWAKDVVESAVMPSCQLSARDSGAPVATAGRCFIKATLPTTHPCERNIGMAGCSPCNHSREARAVLRRSGCLSAISFGSGSRQQERRTLMLRCTIDLCAQGQPGQTISAYRPADT